MGTKCKCFFSIRFHLHWRCHPPDAHSHSVHRATDGWLWPKSVPKLNGASRWQRWDDGFWHLDSWLSGARLKNNYMSITLVSALLVCRHHVGCSVEPHSPAGQPQSGVVHLPGCSAQRRAHRLCIQRGNASVWLMQRGQKYSHKYRYLCGEKTLVKIKVLIQLFYSSESK